MKKHSAHSTPFTTEVLEQYNSETPVFIFSKEILRQKYQEFKDLFPEAEICYAMKANAEPELLQILADWGSSFEVASMYELDMLKDLKVPAERIIYGTAVKPSNHIKAFFDYGVDRFACDSMSELEKIANIAPGAKVYIRASANDAGSVFKFSEKFGTSIDNIVPIILRSVELKMIPYGISFNVGSQASNPMAWNEAIESLIPIIKDLEKHDIKLEMLDIGGGFPCTKYTSTENLISLEEISENINSALKKLPYKLNLILEPGRAIVAESAVLLTSVFARIERNKYTWLFLDVGVYGGLFETMAYQGSTRYRVTMLRRSFDSGEMSFALAGPTGDSPDVISREVFLPADVSVGDKLVIHDVGAYSLVAICPFNGFPRPKVYFI